MRTQDQFTNMLKAATVERGLDFIDDQNYANTGTFRILRAGTLSEVLRISYQFNTGHDAYATFTITTATQPREQFSPNFADLGAALDKIVAKLPAKPTAKKRGYRPLNVVQS